MAGVEKEITRLAFEIKEKKMHQNEPVWILRGSDPNAAKVIRYWAQLSANSGVANEVLEEAQLAARELEAWPAKALPQPTSRP